MKKIISLLLLLMAVGASYAQTITITGKVIAGDDKLPIIGAYISLNASDSASLSRPGRVVVTDADGIFTIKSNEPQSDITIGYLGYKTYFTKIESGKNEVDLGSIVLPVESIVVENVTIVGRAAISRVSGDTVQYNAAAFKTNPDATTEDLLKKMPGVTTDDNGAIQSQGQAIGKVYVNGKEYFEADPSLALKSLPADAVQSIQLYDDQSDQAKFSGFDDGERIRAINIVTKAGVTNSTFGKAYGGYGTDDRYAAGIGVNSFTDNHRFTLIGQTNNVNNQGFTLSDIGSSMGGRGGGRGGMNQGGSDMGSFTTSARGGIRTTNMAGLNYNGQFGEKLKLSGNYFFNGRKADNWSIMNQNYLSTSRNFAQRDTTLSYDYQHRLNLRSEWNPNEYNRINFNPRVSYSTNHGNKFNESETARDGQLTNAAQNNYNTDLMSYNLSADLWWQHRFAKAGRTLSLGGIANGRKAIGDRYQLSDYGSVSDPGGWIQELLDQYGRIVSSGSTLTGSFTYAEPLNENSRVSANYSIRYDRSISDSKGFEYDQLLQEYSIIDPLTTNYFSRNYTTQTAGLGYNLVKGKDFTLNTTLNYQNAQLNNNESYPREPWSNQSKYNFSSVLPGVKLVFNPSQGQSLNIDYNANSIFPSVTQLQDVLDVTNPLQVSRGNPDLKQSYTNRLNIRYNYANSGKNSNFSIFANATQTSDYIANHRMFLTEDMNVEGTVIPSGAQYTVPVNLQGYWNAGMFSTYSFGVKPLKSNMNASAFYRYSSVPSIEDYIKYRSKVHNIGVNLSLTSNISENVDFTLSYRPGVNLTKGGTGNFDRYWGHNLSAFVNVIFWKGFFVNLDASWRNTFGTQPTYTQHFALVNAAVGKKFLKYKQAEIKMQGYDLLNQNRSLWQTSNDTYIQTTTSNVLKRYFMFSFTYKFDTRKGRSIDNYGSDNNRGGDEGRQFHGRPGGGPPPGGGGPPR